MDVYALGAVLYELLTGHAPFEDAKREKLLRRTMSSLLGGVSPLHRIALLTARQKLGLPLDESDRDTQARLAALALGGLLAPR